ncbi:mucin-5AC-like [Anopheles nili]|uniref:mucin-5AC-like n=1 Tax=Anopheles nili TaxID=185578 RepID=UPI00237A99F3|nr:mucin-5AC-like [Anopheles nili]
MMNKVFGAVFIILQTLTENSLQQQSSGKSVSVPESVVCESVGRIPNDASESCTSYYLCTMNSESGQLVPLLAQCPGATIFSRELAKCVEGPAYLCQNASFQIAPTESNLGARESNTVQTVNSELRCTSTGSFPNFASTDCKTYFLCLENTDGSFIEYLTSCPLSTVFSPDESRCVDSSLYICPNEKTTTTSNVQSTTTPVVPPFVCPSLGRFVNEQSLDCKTYFLCIMQGNDQLVPMITSCPSSTIFSAIELKCVSTALYTCPKQTTSTEPTTTEMTSSNNDSTSDSPLTTPGTSTTSTHQTETSEIPLTTPGSGTNSPTPTNIPLTTPGVPTTPGVTPTHSQSIESTTSTQETSEIPLTTPGAETNSPTPTDIPLTTPGVPTIPTTTPAYSSTIESTTSTQETSEIPLTTPEAETNSPTPTDIPLTTPGVPTTPGVSPTHSQTIELTTSTQKTSEIPLTTPGAETNSPTPTDIPLTTPGVPTTPGVSPTHSQTIELTTSTQETSEIPLTTPGAETNSPTPTDIPLTTPGVPTTPGVSPTHSQTIELTTSTQETSEIPLTTPGAETNSPTPTDIPLTTPGVPTTPGVSPTHSQTIESTTSTQETSETPKTSESGSVDGTTTLLPIGTSTNSFEFECPDQGRYPDPRAVECESYLLCITNSYGTLTPVKFFCPYNAIFSETMYMCVSKELFSCGIEFSTASTPSSTQVITSTIVIPTPTPFVCPQTGRYSNPDSIYCKSYYLCVYDGKMNLIFVELSCPPATIFVEQEHKCVSANEYECTPASTELTTPVTTTTEVQGRCDTTGGRLANYAANDCKTYLFCAKLTSGEIVEIPLNCPSNTLFDEKLKICSDSYICPRND